MEKKYTIELTQNELQVILNSLIKEPYANVFMLVANLQNQVSPQLQKGEDKETQPIKKK